MGAIRRAFLVVPALVLALAVAVGVAAANTFTSGPLVQVSGASPFAGCAADATATQSGTVVVGSEVEPWVDVNPTNSMNLVGIWQQDRWSNGGARGLVAGASIERRLVVDVRPDPGGHALRRRRLPARYRSVGLVRAERPRAPAGARVQRLEFRPRALRQLLGGRRGHLEHTTGRDPRSRPDRVQRQAVDHRGSGRPERLRGLGSARLPERAGEHRRRDPRRRFPRADVVQPQHQCRRHLGTAAADLDPGQNDQTIGNQIVVLPNGTLVDIFTEFNNENAKKLRGGTSGHPLVRQGNELVEPFLIDRELPIGVFDPETGEDVRTGEIIPDIAVAPSGTLYAVWEDARFSGFVHEAVAFSQSVDGGLSWSTPIQVNLTPTTSRREPAGVHAVGRCPVRRHGRSHVLRLPEQHAESGDAPDRLLRHPSATATAPRRRAGRRGAVDGCVVRHEAAHRSRAASLPATTRDSHRPGRRSCRSGPSRTRATRRASSSAESVRSSARGGSRWVPAPTHHEHELQRHERQREELS